MHFLVGAYKPTVHGSKVMDYVLGWYIGMAVLVSLKLPNRIEHVPEVYTQVTPVIRVMVGLVWPVYYLFYVVGRFL